MRSITSGPSAEMAASSVFLARFLGGEGKAFHLSSLGHFWRRPATAMRHFVIDIHLAFADSLSPSLCLLSSRRFGQREAEFMTLSTNSRSLVTTRFPAWWDSFMIFLAGSC